MSSSRSTQELGQHGETLAAAALTERGYTILERNWRCSTGEIDIVALHDGELVIVEVRTRRGAASYDRALESINTKKQEKLFVLAEIYQAEHDDLELSGIRIDVVIVSVGRDGTFVNIFPGAVGW